MPPMWLLSDSPWIGGRDLPNKTLSSLSSSGAVELISLRTQWALTTPEFVSRRETVKSGAFQRTIEK